MLIADAHLDLAFNAVRGRDVTQPAAQQQIDELGTPSVGLPDLLAGGVALICGTIFCQPASSGHGGYTTADQAHDMAQQQLTWYQNQIQANRLRMVRNRRDLDDPQKPTPLPMLLLLEGADAIRSEADAHAFFQAGLRIVGLAWKQTRLAGGTGDPGPLTAEGRSLVQTLDRLGIIHDISHLAEESFWQLIELSAGPIMASHSNCRALIPTDRQLSDEMIHALLSRGGMIGVNFFDRFLIPPAQYGHRRARLADVIAHIRHLADLAGHTRQIGIGSDMDGGFGQEKQPAELATSADLPKLATALANAGFSDPDIHNIMGQNWLRFFRHALPDDL